MSVYQFNEQIFWFISVFLWHLRLCWCRTSLDLLYVVTLLTSLENVDLLIKTRRTSVFKQQYLNFVLLIQLEGQGVLRYVLHFRRIWWKWQQSNFNKERKTFNNRVRQMKGFLHVFSYLKLTKTSRCARWWMPLHWNPNDY